jgi:Protein of unknown function (DUF2612)
MTFPGPPVPPPPAPGSNAIGKFQIGTSPIGTIPPFNTWETIIDEYATSPIITGIATSFGAAADMTAAFDLFFDSQWNPDTASGPGLDVIGRIVGVTRTLQISGEAGPFLGFEEADDPDDVGFNQAPFYTGSQLTQNFQLQDSDFRKLINAKMLLNICDGSIPAINNILLTLFPNRGPCYVTDGLNMTMTYTFAFTPTAIELAILQQSNVLPTPAGVVATLVYP